MLPQENSNKATNLDNYSNVFGFLMSNYEMMKATVKIKFYTNYKKHPILKLRIKMGFILTISTSEVFWCLWGFSVTRFDYTGA